MEIWLDGFRDNCFTEGPDMFQMRGGCLKMTYATGRLSLDDGRAIYFRLE